MLPKMKTEQDVICFCRDRKRTCIVPKAHQPHAELAPCTVFWSLFSKQGFNSFAQHPFQVSYYYFVSIWILGKRPRGYVPCWVFSLYLVQARGGLQNSHWVGYLGLARTLPRPLELRGSCSGVARPPVAPSSLAVGCRELVPHSLLIEIFNLSKGDMLSLVAQIRFIYFDSSWRPTGI